MKRAVKRFIRDFNEDFKKSAEARGFWPTLARVVWVGIFCYPPYLLGKTIAWLARAAANGEFSRWRDA